jgi:Phage tail tube protein, TTP
MAGQVEVWAGVRVDMESARGATKTITAISKAANAVITATHDFANGDFVELEVEGMTQINGVFRVINVSTTVSFEVEDLDGTSIDSSLFDDFSTGTAEKITFGTSITTATNVNGSGGDPDRIDITTIHDTIRRQQYGAVSPLEYTMEHNWDIANTGQKELIKASNLGLSRAFRFRFRSGKIMVFVGNVSFVGVPTGQAQDKVTSPATITAQALPRYYVS